MRLRPSIEAAGQRARLPLPKTARSQAGHCLDTRARPGWLGTPQLSPGGVCKPFWSRGRSAAHAEAVDQRAVPLHVDLRQVLAETTAPADQQQQTSSRVVIVLVDLEVLSQVVDALGKQRDLCLRRTGVGLVQAVLGQDFFLLFGSKRHDFTPCFGPRS